MAIITSIAIVYTNVLNAVHNACILYIAVMERCRETHRTTYSYHGAVSLPHYTLYVAEA